ncbi:hypothetical protein HanRHA438_Chr11g0518241 [Helianthus annuus]|nr:hypothetical protein HanIR_Chr11g0544281 [Helianthus annuus]KAJ0871948.1 hypothetical protein HanRHA438_Chr11g0518241 [Helianthus annuus]
MMLMILNMEEDSNHTCLYLDNERSNHMMRNRDMFLNLNDSERREVRTGDDKRPEVPESCKVSINLHGKEKVIPIVFYIQGLKHNLLSVGQLVQKGYDIPSQC